MLDFTNALPYGFSVSSSETFEPLTILECGSFYNFYSFCGNTEHFNVLFIVSAVHFASYLTGLSSMMLI